APSARQSVRAALALLRYRIVLARTVFRALRNPNRLQSIGNEAENNRRDRDDAEQHARADQVADEIRPGVHQVDDEHAAEETEDGTEGAPAEERPGNCAPGRNGRAARSSATEPAYNSAEQTAADAPGHGVGEPGDECCAGPVHHGSWRVMRITCGPAKSQSGFRIVLSQSVPVSPSLFRYVRTSRCRRPHPQPWVCCRTSARSANAMRFDDRPHHER